MRAIDGRRAGQRGENASESGGKETGEDIDRRYEAKLQVSCGFHHKLPKRHDRFGDELRYYLSSHVQALLLSWTSWTRHLASATSVCEVDVPRNKK
jgi:hypothetical protein